MLSHTHWRTPPTCNLSGGVLHLSYTKLPHPSHTVHTTPPWHSARTTAVTGKARGAKVSCFCFAFIIDCVVEFMHSSATGYGSDERGRCGKTMNEYFLYQIGLSRRSHHFLARGAHARTEKTRECKQGPPRQAQRLPWSPSREARRSPRASPLPKYQHHDERAARIRKATSLGAVLVVLQFR